MYIEAHRTRHRAQDLIKLIELGKIARMFVQHVKATHDHRRQVWGQVVVYLRFCALWNFRLVKFGPKKLHHAYKNRIRQCYAFATNLQLGRFKFQ